MKFKYIIEHTYSHMKEFEVHSDKELDDGDIIALSSSSSSKGLTITLSFLNPLS